jgi:acyl-CoA thioesterase FadM
MMKPKLYKSTHRCSFIELDPFGHMNTLYYLSHYLEHRFTGMREVSGLDLRKISQLPFIFVTKDLKIEFIRSIMGDSVFTIESEIDTWSDTSCTVACRMITEDGKLLSKCTFTFTCIHKGSNQAGPWPDGIKELFFESKT